MSTQLKWSRCGVAILVSLSVGFGIWACALRQMPTSGAVIESCARAEAGDAAGLRPGDVVIAWRQGDDAGPIESPFHLARVEQERAPVGPVELTVSRGWRERRIAVPTGRWRVQGRPILREESLVRHHQAVEQAETGDLEAAVAQWKSLAAESAEQGLSLDAAWFHIQVGRGLATVNRRDECVSELSAGADGIDDPRLRAVYWERAGNDLFVAGRRQVAAFAFKSAVENHRSEGSESPALAFALLQLCRSDLRACREEPTSALEIYLRVGTENLESAAAMASMGAVAYFRSDLDGAQKEYTRALDVVRAVVDGSPAECELLGNLGLVAMRRGDLDRARELFRQEMTVARRLGHDTPQFSYAANYLGLLAKNLGRYEEARLYYEQALTSFNATRPEGVEVAGVLTNLGNVAMLEGNLEAARRHHEEALRLRQLLAPESSDVAASLHNVGLVARWQGDSEVARRFLEQALALKSGFSPGSPWVANTIFELGEVARGEGQLEESERLHLRSLEIYQETSPRHHRVAKSLMVLGEIDQTRGQPESAEARWREAIGIIEESRQRMEISDEERSKFGARYYSAYGSLARLLVDDGRDAEAWDLLERARAATLREVVARRGAMPRGIPSDLWFAKNQTERRIARIESRLLRQDPSKDESALLRYRAQLELAEAQLRLVMEEIGNAAPRYASFSRPEASTFQDTVELLDPGTVVISYSLGEERSTALVVAAGVDGEPQILTFPIPLGAPDFSSRLNIFFSLVSRGQTVDEVEPAFIAQAQKFFSLLVEPVLDVVSAADRVLIVPDGPLVDLPFAALVLPGDGTEFFGHWKPLFFSPSASVFAEIKGLRGDVSAEETTVVAFGDPVYPQRSSLADQYRLDPLPGSRDEVESIERLLGSRATTFLGAAATEDNFRELGSGSRVVHCALHAVADPRFPMESALFFSLPEDPGHGDQDGVLWAWEVADELDIGADVVVLSACSTGRGRAVEGEGIYGLARAFQYAGVRTLVASQWEIPDRSTAELMAYFYSSLKDGLSTAEALREAQSRLAKSDPSTAHPFHWASFQVRGDWR